MNTNKRLLFVGAGAMAEAIIAGIRGADKDSATDITVMNKSDYDRLARLESVYDVRVYEDVQEAIASNDIIILAMKPKDVDAAMIRLRDYVEEKHIIFSVLAGTTTSHITDLLEKNNPVIRAMPNTSANVLQSATAVSKGRTATDTELELARSLFITIGTVTEVGEEQMDAVTGISGSGPAYMYYLMEGLLKSANRAGLSSEEAKRLIVQTMLGAATRWSQTDESLEHLYQEVMSPGGTTEAAFKLLEAHDVQTNVSLGADAAIQRSKELGARKQDQK